MSKDTISPWMPERSAFVLRRVGKTAEEAAELVKVCNRIVIQGIDGIDPDSGDDNRHELFNEMADVSAQIEINMRAFGLSIPEMNRRMRRKIELMHEWERVLIEQESKEPEITPAMKAELIGEFAFSREMGCPVCDHDGEPCDVCGGSGHYMETIDVPWTMCKTIYKAMTKAASKGER